MCDSSLTSPIPHTRRASTGRVALSVADTRARGLAVPVGEVIALAVVMVMMVMPGVFVPAEVVEEHSEELDEFALIEPL
jgi:hypothetical protein